MVLLAYSAVEVSVPKSTANPMARFIRMFW